MLWYDVDWSGPVSTENVGAVDVPPVNNPLQPFLQDILIQEIDTSNIQDLQQMYIATHLFVNLINTAAISYDKLCYLEYNCTEV